MIADHLNLDSSICCNAIPQQDITEVITEEQKKKWTSETIAKCEKAEAKKMEFRNIYTGESLFDTDILLDLVETYSRSYQGKLHVDLKIKTKLSKGIKLDPEERKINYRTRVVRKLQQRVMDHIFGDKSFLLKDLSKLCDWMATDKAERDFLNSCLVAGIQGKGTSLSHSTIATLACSMIELLKYVSFPTVTRRYRNQ